jgi:hypothetical protein
LGLLALLGFSAVGMEAQNLTATINGTLRDSSGAVVPGAQVRVVMDRCYISRDGHGFDDVTWRQDQLLDTNNNNSR